MYYNQSQYPYPRHPQYPSHSAYYYPNQSAYYSNHPAYYPMQPGYRQQYPPVDIKIFSQSIQSFRLLMNQGSILLDRLGDADFDKKMMEAAQKGDHAGVDKLIQSLGLKVPVKTKFTPSSVNFGLTTNTDPNSPENCCSLTVNMKWGK